METGKVFDNEYVRLEAKNGVVYGWYKEGTVDMEAARSIVSNRKAFTDHQPVKILVMQAGLKGIKRDARAYLSSEEAVEGIIGAAILSTNAFQRHLANFFLAITVIRPKVPTRLFSDEKEALKWLNTLD